MLHGAMPSFPSPHASLKLAFLATIRYLVGSFLSIIAMLQLPCETFSSTLLILGILVSHVLGGSTTKLFV